MPTTPQETPYNKVNIVDAEGNLISLGGGGQSSNGATATNQETEISLLENNLGTDITGATMAAGGAGIRGWLSGIYVFLLSRLPILVSGRLPVDVSSLSVTVNNAQLEIANDVGNPIPVIQVSPTTVNTAISNPFPISSTASIIASNSDRKGLTIYSPLNFDIFVGFQNSVSSTSYAVRLTPEFNYYELPYSYKGIVSIASASGNIGIILVRELI